MALKVYGLKNCDTCKKATKWLAEEGKEHRFFDLRKDGFEKSDVTRWLGHVGLEKLLNKRGTTWRNLDEDTKNSVNEDSAIELFLEQPALMKRPIFDFQDRVVVGFTAKEKEEL